jgi:hypothetical protein
MLAGVCFAAAGGLALVAGALMYVWLPKQQRNENADKRRHELTTGERLEVRRSLYSPNGRHRLEMAEDGNLIEWGDGIVVMWKSDTQDTEARFLTLLADGELRLCNKEGEKVKTIAPPQGGTRLCLQDDAQLVLNGPGKSQPWRTGIVIGVTWGTRRQ